MEELLPPKPSTADSDRSRHSHNVVQAPMESPLNLAHASSRRADMFTKSRKYEEAISSHREAAGFLLEAMNVAPSSTPASLLESLSLQHKAYLSEINRLQCKNQLLDLMDRSNKATETISQASQTDSIHSMDTTEQASLDEAAIYEILRENDDVVNRLGNLNKQEEKVDKSSSSGPVHSKTIISAEPTVEEVVQVNEKLSHAVRSLLQELGSTRAEKRQMEEKLCDSQESVRHGTEAELKFYSLNLPPLEVSYPELAIFKMDT